MNFKDKRQVMPATVSCEKCHAEFALEHKEVAEINLKGRILKCGNCHHMWLVDKIGGAIEELDKEVKLKPLTHNAQDSRLIGKISNKKNHATTLLKISPNQKLRNKRSDISEYAKLPLWLKMITYTLVFFLILSILITQKDSILKNIPLSNLILTPIGLKDNKGLSFKKVTILKYSLEDGHPLIIDGFIKNDSFQKKKVPDMRLKFLDNEGNLLEEIDYQINGRVILPQEKAKISTRINEYPKNTDTIELEIGTYLEFLLR